jgi:3-hydroxybutyryl-CoA dehydrogenase
MVILIKATEQQRQQLQAKGFASSVQIQWMDKTILPADVYMDLTFELEGAAFATITDAPVIVNAVIATCGELPENYIRINAWPGFLQSKITEFAAAQNYQTIAGNTFEQMGWQSIAVIDQPGLIAARVVAMIINEAYFGLEDNISTKADIDIAMKLGTNYPFGPFEWARQIGLQYIVQLLDALSIQNTRYTPAPLLKAESIN